MGSGVKVEGLRNVNAALARMQAVMAPAQRRRLLLAAGAAVSRYIHKCFAEERAPEWPASLPGAGAARSANAAAGRPWEPLAEATIAGRRKGPKKGQGQVRILQDTGNLRKSVGMFATSDYVEVGSREPYGHYHQTGTKRVPARPFVGWNRRDAWEFEKRVWAAIERAAR